MPVVVVLLELSFFLLPYGIEPPGKEFLGQTLALPPSGCAELAEILGAKSRGPGRRVRDRWARRQRHRVSRHPTRSRLAGR